MLMRSQQSKLQNRSTSSSDFFAKRYPETENFQSQPMQHGISSYISSGITQQPSSLLQKSSKIIQQSTKVVNEYQMFQPSKIFNQNQTSVKSSVKQISDGHYEPKNPFLSRNYESLSKNKKDIIYENNFSKETFGSSYKQVRFQNDLKKNKKITEHQPFSKKYDLSHGFQEFNQQKRSYSSHKQNIQPYTSKAVLSTQNHYNNSQLLQPVTLNRSASDKNLIPSMGISRFQDTSILDEPHRMLDHIYFTIAHESDLRDVFKQFAIHQQQRINQRFREMVMSLENTLNEIKITFDKRIDEAYKNLLGQLDSIKAMAELMWKNKRSKTFSTHKFEEIPRVPRYEVMPDRNRERPGSKHGYYKFSELEMRSPESNNMLLKQLFEEDERMGEYKKTKHFYQTESEYGNEVDRDRLLREMYEVSRCVARMIKQCEHGFLDEVLGDKRQKKNGLIWFAETSNQGVWNGGHNNDERREMYEIGQVMVEELYELDNLVDGFRSSLKHKYKSS